jgi:hypothetical protein
MPTIQANSITIAYDIDGTGEPLVLIVGAVTAVTDFLLWHHIMRNL